MNMNKLLGKHALYNKYKLNFSIFDIIKIE